MVTESELEQTNIQIVISSRQQQRCYDHYPCILLKYYIVAFGLGWFSSSTLYNFVQMFIQDMTQLWSSSCQKSLHSNIISCAVYQFNSNQIDLRPVTSAVCFCLFTNLCKVWHRCVLLNRLLISISISSFDSLSKCTSCTTVVYQGIPSGLLVLYRALLLIYFYWNLDTDMIFDFIF